jgi:hypothetical protein
MKVTYELSVEDYYEAVKACSRTKTWEIWAIWAIFAAFTCLIAWMVFLTLSSGAPLKRLVPTVAFWFLMLACLVLAIIMRRSAATRQLEHNVSAQGLMTLTVLDNGIHLQNQHGDGTRAWSSFVRWSEGKSVLLLMTSPVTCMPVPKRAFTPDQLNAFREILRSKIRNH